MTAAKRQALRESLDRARRQQLALTAPPTHPQACGGCGGERGSWVLGCRVCSERHYKWYKEGRHPNPSWYLWRKMEVAAEAEQRRSLHAQQAARTRHANGGGKPTTPSPAAARSLRRFFVKEVAA